LLTTLHPVARNTLDRCWQHPTLLHTTVTFMTAAGVL
jgi:hypothetical protein